MRTSGFDKNIAAYGQVIPLAFVYDDTAYYFDVDGFDDAKTTVAVRKGGGVVEGLAANRALVDAVHKYGAERKRVWMAKWFKDCVAAELEEE